MDVGPIGEEAVDGVLDVWVGVNGVDNFDVVARGEAVEGEADTLKTSAETFTAVGGDEDQAFGGVEEGAVNAAGKSAVGEAIANVEDGINARVTGNVGSFGGNAFAVEIGGGPGSGGEVDIGEAAGEDAIHLFGEGLGHVPGSEAGLDVADGNAGVEGGKGAAEGGGGVALNDGEFGFKVGEDGFEGGQHSGGGLEKRLAWEHEIQIDIRGDMEGGQDLIEHLTVLAGDTDLDIEKVRRGLKMTQDRAEFNGFRARSKEEKSSNRQVVTARVQ